MMMGTYELPKREIKFRAWDKKEETILDWGFLLNVTYTDIFNDDDLVLMQYTGLKDKNGVEIYEGDIVEIYFPEKVLDRSDAVDMFGAEPQNNYPVAENILREKHIISVVKFINGRFAYKVFGGQCDMKEELANLIGKRLKMGLRICKKDEVIGNVFENPELLETNQPIT